MFLFGQALHGAAGAVLYTIGPAFIDGSVSAKNSPAYLGSYLVIHRSTRVLDYSSSQISHKSKADVGVVGAASYVNAGSSNLKSIKSSSRWSISLSRTSLVTDPSHYPVLL